MGAPPVSFADCELDTDLKPEISNTNAPYNFPLYHPLGAGHSSIVAGMVDKPFASGIPGACKALLLHESIYSNEIVGNTFQPAC